MKDTTVAGDRAGTLIRVSSDGQNEANQVPDVERYTRDHGYREVKSWVLHDKSAYKGEQQEALNQVIADMKAGIIKVLIVWHSDRLDRRGVREALTFLWQVQDAGARVESVKEGLLDERNLTTIINAHMNNEKSEHLSDQVQIAYNRIRGNRAFQGVAPFGYEITGPKYDKQLTVIEELRPIVAEIFVRVIAGESLATICTWLDTLKVKKAAAGVPQLDANGKSMRNEDGDVILKYQKGDITPWWPAMLQRMIRHPAYTGRYYCKHFDKDADNGKGKLTNYVHTCEPIVGIRIQRQAIEVLRDREKRGAPADPANAAMLRSAIFCARCEDSPMYKASLKINGRADSPRRAHYRCWGRGRGRKSCGNTVPMDLVDAAVNKIIAGTFNRPIMRYELIKGHDWEDEIQAVKDEIAALGTLGLSDDEEDAKRAELRAERDRLDGLPADDDEWREVETDETYADVYAGLETYERGAWLKSYKFTVTAAKQAVTVSQGYDSITLPLT